MSKHVQQIGTGVCVSTDGEIRRSHPTQDGARYEIHRLIAHGAREGRSKRNRRGTGHVQIGVRKCGLCGGFHVTGRRRGQTSGYSR